jgi:hypothetical protein
MGRIGRRGRIDNGGRGVTSRGDRGQEKEDFRVFDRISIGIREQRARYTQREEGSKYIETEKMRKGEGRKDREYRQMEHEIGASEIEEGRKAEWTEDTEAG